MGELKYVSFVCQSTLIDSILKREIENIFVNEKSRFSIGILQRVFECFLNVI